MTNRLTFETAQNYLDQQVDEHIESLEDSMRSGCNIIDTSSNYTNGASETLIGNVLTKMMNQGEIERDEIILVSKTGYIQGDNLSQAIKREKTDQSWPEIVKYTDGCWHCIHPDFLIDQWERSANRLQVETIDVYLLHNPEYFFSEAKKSGAPESLPQLRDEFYQRIFQAFVQMERFVQEKKILFFGVSANTFVAPKHDFEHVSLSRVHTEALKAADKAKEEAEKVSNEYDEMIKKAQAEAQSIVAKGKEAGNNLRDEIERKAKEKADELLEKSNKQIEAVKAKAIDEIKSVSVDLAIQAASKVINKNLDDSTNRDLAKSTINEAN